MSPKPTRRQPRFGRFIGTGAVLGVLAGVLLAYVRGGGPDYEPGQAALYSGLLLGILGGLVGGLVAVLLDGRAPRR